MLSGVGTAPISGKMCPLGVPSVAVEEGVLGRVCDAGTVQRVRVSDFTHPMQIGSVVPVTRQELGHEEVNLTMLPLYARSNGRDEPEGPASPRLGFPVALSAVETAFALFSSSYIPADLEPPAVDRLSLSRKK